MRIRNHHPLTRLLTASTCAAGLAIALAIPAQATTPADFNAPIFGTTATLTGARMPSIADIQCSDAACTNGVLPSGIFLNPARYLSTTIATGATLAAESGFIATVNADWSTSLNNAAGDVALFALQLAEFAPGTDLTATVTNNSAEYAGTLTGPTTVDGQQTWTREDTTDARFAVRLAYAGSGTTLVRTMCYFTPAMAAKNPCVSANMVKVAVATANRPAPTVLPVSRAMRSLIPTTPSNLTPVIMSTADSSLVWGASGANAAVKKLLRPTKSVILQYAINSAPQLYFMVRTARVKGAAVAAFAKDICQGSGADASYICTSSVVNAKKPIYIGSIATADRPKQVLDMGAAVVGNGVLAVVSCAMIDNQRPMTAKEVAACRAGIASIGRAILE
jgi:hypothetical protein